MKEYTLSQQYALIGLEGQDSIHATAAKNAVCRCIAAAKLLERLVLTEDPGSEAVKEELEAGFKEIRSIGKKEARALETEVAETLKAEGVLDEVPDIMACDINYNSMNMELKVYRSDEVEYQRTAEGVRAEMLEGGAVTLECACLVWLFRESGCIHEIFSVNEQEELAARMIELAEQEPVIRVIWDLEIYRWTEKLSQQLLGAKKNLFKNPYMEGVNLLFPFLDRRQAIFIDFVIFGTDVAGRRMAILNYLTEKGHYVEEVKNGSETLLKVDNYYYRVFPMTKVYYKVPVQGANLVPVYK